MHSERPVKLRNMLAYGCGEFYGGGSFIVISLLFIFFLTDIVGISPFLAGLIVMIGKGWDALSDPVMGHISDNMRSRHGRRRIFFLIGIIPVAVTFFMLWVSVRFQSEIVDFLYYALAYLLFSTVFTMVMIPYRALNAEMTPDYKIRTRLTATKAIFSQVASLLSATVPKLIVDRLYADNPADGFFVMGIIFGLFYALPWLIVYIGTWETTVSGEEPTTSFWSFFSNFKSLFINKSFRIQLGMYISAYTAMDILMAMFIYYLTYYLGRKDIFSLCMGFMIITNIAFVPLYTFIANRKGKGSAYIVGLIIWFCAMALSTLMSSSTPVFMIVILAVLIGIGLSAAVLMPWAMLPEIIDVDEIIMGRQRAGTCSGAMTLVRKLVQAVALFVFGIVLDLIGYVPNVAQSESTLFWLRIMFFVLPGILIILGVVVALRFRITPQTHGILRAELERLNAGGDKSEAGDETREICGLLTGVSWEKLYPVRS